MNKIIKILFIIIIFIFVFVFYRFNFTSNDIKTETESGNIIKYDEKETLNNININYDNLENIAEVYGDLDNDGVDEKIVVYNTDRILDLGTEREIHIYKKNNDDWGLINKSIGAVLPSLHGGVIGEPFVGLSIDNGIIEFNHFGGSRTKWSYLHKFKLINGVWSLVGAKINYSAPCESLEDFNYNLETGQIIIETEYEECNLSGDWVKTAKETKEFNSPMNILPIMDGFYPGNNRIIISEINREFYY